MAITCFAPSSSAFTSRCVRLPEQIVFQHDDRVGPPFLNGPAGVVQAAAAQQAQPQAVALRHGEAELGVAAGRAQCPGDVGRRPHHGLAAAARARDDQRTLGLVEASAILSTSAARSSGKSLTGGTSAPSA